MLSALPTDCVALRVASDLALELRLKDELLATVGLPVRDDVTCATSVIVDDDRRLVVTATGVAPPVVLGETLGGGSVVTRAAHIAEIVRGVLLEVEQRSRPPADRQVVVESPPPPPAVLPKPEPSPERLEVRFGGGGVLAMGGLSPGLSVEAGAAFHLSKVFAVGVGVLGTAVQTARTVPEGVLRARPFAAWLAISSRFPAATSWNVSLSVTVGGAWLPLEGIAVAPFEGAQANAWSVTTGADVRVAWRLAGPVGLWLGVAFDWFWHRPALEVAGQGAAAFGPLAGRARGGLEVAW